VANGAQHMLKGFDDSPTACVTFLVVRHRTDLRSFWRGSTMANDQAPKLHIEIEPVRIGAVGWIGILAAAVILAM
jgi:hypothetical protein